jgi:preprotein translocase subunit SecA
MLRIIDAKWREHLAEMDYLREGINLRSMGQQDPLVAWQREGFALFGKLMSAIDDDYLRHITHVEVLTEDVEPQDLSSAKFVAAENPVRSPMAAAEEPEVPGGPAEEDVAQQPVVNSEMDKIKRNDPCWCGSGKKYKNCHGAG